MCHHRERRKSYRQAGRPGTLEDFEVLNTVAYPDNRDLYRSVTRHTGIRHHNDVFFIEAQFLVFDVIRLMVNDNCSNDENDRNDKLKYDERFAGAGCLQPPLQRAF